MFFFHRYMLQYLLGQSDRERTSLADLAAETDLSTHQGYQFLDDRQPQANTPGLARGRHIHLPERVKNKTLGVRRDARACIRNFQGPLPLTRYEYAQFDF